MDKIIIRQVKRNDLDDCYAVENACYTTEGATKEKIKKRIQVYPEGFLVADLDGEVIGLINSASTNKRDISDEELKNMVGHEHNGKNIVIFSLAVLPKFQGRGASKLLMLEFIRVSKKLGKEKILLICKRDLIEYYKKYDFAYIGKSKSKHGGFDWYEMCLELK